MENENLNFSSIEESSLKKFKNLKKVFEKHLRLDDFEIKIHFSELKSKKYIKKFSISRKIIRNKQNNNKKRYRPNIFPFIL